MSSWVPLGQPLCPEEKVRIFWKTHPLYVFIQGNKHKSIGLEPCLGDPGVEVVHVSISIRLISNLLWKTSPAACMGSANKLSYYFLQILNHWSFGTRVSFILLLWACQLQEHPWADIYTWNTRCGLNLSAQAGKMNAQLVPVGGDGGVKAPSNFVECKL